MGQLRYRLIGLLLVGFPAPLCHAAGGAGPADAEMEGLRADVAAMKAVRDRLLAQVRQRDKGVEPAVVIELRLTGVISYPGGHGATGKDDFVATLWRGAGRWLPSQGGTPGWYGGPHFVDAGGLTFDGKRLSGTLRAAMAFGRGKFNCHSRRMDVEFTIDAGVEAGKVSGTYSTAGAAAIPETPWHDATSEGITYRAESAPVAPRKGALIGSVREAAFVPAAAAEPQIELGGGYEGMLHKRACWLETQACRLYREVHGCALALEHGWAVEHAFAATPEYLPARAELKTAGAGGEKPPGTNEPPKRLDIGEGDDLGLDGPKAPGPPRGAGVAAAGAAKANPALLAALGPIREHVGAMRRLAEAWRAGQGGEYAVDGADCGDPAFGPYYGEQELPRERGGHGVLPGAQAEGGNQEWRLIGGWTFLGPLPGEFCPVALATLPEVVPAWDAPLTVASRLRGVAKQYLIPDTLAPLAADSNMGQSRTGLGHTRPPSIAQWETGLTPRRVDLPRTSFHAATRIIAPSPREVWLGVTINDGGALWVNDRLVWMSRPEKDPARDERTGLARAALVRGVNRLVVRLDNHTDETYFSLRVCVGGQPAPPEAAKRRQTELAKAYESLKQPAGEGAVSGWRGDGTGRWPAARPPVAWDIEKGMNVAWRVPLESSHATPVIAGERVFTNLEPHTLLCLNKADGKELWRRDCEIFELRGEEIRKEAAGAREGTARARAQLAALGRTKAERMEALAKQGLDANQAAERYEELSRGGAAYLQLLRKAGVQGPAWNTVTGHTISTPVTDGRCVWVKYNTGVLACFDMEGNRKWMIDHGGSTGTSSHVPSPVLCAGRLIVMLPASGFARVHDYKKVTSTLRAYEPDTGRELWTAATAEGTSGEVTGTPLPMRLTNGREALDVVVTANGTVVRVQDGKVLRMYLGSREEYGSPIGDGRGRVIISGPHHKACYELLMQDRDSIGVRTAWQVWHPGVGYDSGNYALLEGGLLYAFGWRLDVLDAADGAVRSMRHDLLWIRPGRCYPAIAMAGGRLYVADYGQFFAAPMGIHHGSGMSVLDSGPDGLLLARNKLDLTTGGPCFDGERMYVRSQNSLTCIGYTGEAGRKYEAEAIAAELLDQLYPDRPATAPAAAPRIARRGSGERGGHGAIRGETLWSRLLPDEWFVLGPAAGGDVQAVRAELTASELTGADGNSSVGFGMAVCGKRQPLAQLSKHRKGWMKDGGLDVQTLAGAAEGTWFLLTALRSDFARMMRVELRGGAARAWLGGVEVKHNQLVDVPEAPLPLVLEVSVAKGAAAEPVMLRFWPSSGAEADAKAWLAELARRKAYLAAAARASPESPGGRRAAKAMEQIER